MLVHTYFMILFPLTFQSLYMWCYYSMQVLMAVRQAVQRAPHYPESHNISGLVSEVRSDFQSAITSYRQAKFALDMMPSCSKDSLFLRACSWRGFRGRRHMHPLRYASSCFTFIQHTYLVGRRSLQL